MNGVTAEHLIGLITSISASMSAAKNELNRLDSALGDGDHGTSLSVAFADAVTRIAVFEQPKPQDILFTTMESLMNRMGGASGALYGTMFLRAGGTSKDKVALNHEDMKMLWRRALEGVMQRGKAQPGEKTMVDALYPAVQAFAEGETLAESFERAAQAAAEGAAQTAKMVARHGRAKFAGERAVGHIDAGARSIAVMFAAMNDYWKEVEHGEA
jgi:dihydroxyacetone kinase-like protein